MISSFACWKFLVEGAGCGRYVVIHYKPPKPWLQMVSGPAGEFSPSFLTTGQVISLQVAMVQNVGGSLVLTATGLDPTS